MFEDKPLDEEQRNRTVRPKNGGGVSVGKRGQGAARSGDENKPNFVILRAEKIKALGNMGASLQHTFRERETPNADETRRRENQILVGPDTAEEVVKSWQDRAPEKVRKNAVLGIEYLITASPEAMARMSRAEQDQYFAKSVNWLKQKHGRENVLSAVIHRDETTPHLTAMVIPLDSRGKLNAREFLGGRQKLRAMQTEFYDRVGRSHGLQRGVEGSKAKHQRVKSYYAALEHRSPQSISLPERRTGGFRALKVESDAEYRERASQAVSEALRAIQDRSLAVNFALTRENQQTKANLKRIEQDRDAARQEAKISREVGRDLYGVGRVLNLMEHYPEERSDDNLNCLAAIVDRLERSPAAPAPEIMQDIRKRMADIDWRAPHREADKISQNRLIHSQEKTDLSHSQRRERER